MANNNGFSTIVISDMEKELGIISNVLVEIETLIELDKQFSKDSKLSDYDCLSLLIYEKKIRLISAIELAKSFALKHSN
jgi:hypothetical protein